MSAKASFQLTGLVAAVHSPFRPDESLHLDIVERQAAHLLAHGITTVFVGGTTGESVSLSLAERLELAAEWARISAGSPLRIVIHVGANSLSDACALAAQAQKLGAAAVSAAAPSYFKSPNVDQLVASMAKIAAAAPGLPFYYYEIPAMTGLAISPSEFLERATEHIPNLTGLKFTSPNLMEYQLCQAAHGGQLDLPFGCDEMLLAALALGARGAVGSTYNFAAPVYHRLLKAFAAGDLEAARREQGCSVQLVRLLAGFGFMGAAKSVMQFLGVDVGPARLPNASLNEQQKKALERGLEALGFFDWIKP